jgi:hypothetical protein
MKGSCVGVWVLMRGSHCLSLYSVLMMDSQRERVRVRVIWGEVSKDRDCGCGGGSRN